MRSGFQVEISRRSGFSFRGQGAKVVGQTRPCLRINTCMWKKRTVHRTCRTAAEQKSLYLSSFCSALSLITRWHAQNKQQAPFPTVRILMYVLLHPPCSMGRVHSELVESQTALCGEKKSYVLRSNRVKLGASAPEG